MQGQKRVYDLAARVTDDDASNAVQLLVESD